MAATFVWRGAAEDTIRRYCILSGTLKGKYALFDAFVRYSIGKDGQGREIGVLFGSLAMRRWNIDIEPKEERIDLSRCPKVLVEF